MSEFLFDYERAFNPLITGHLESASFDLMLNQQQAKQIQSFLALEKGMKILDIPCGTGRHAKLLAEQGFEIDALDYNALFIERAQQFAKEAGLSVNFMQGDMRDLRFKEKYDRIFNVFSSFGYFDDKTNLQVMQEMSSALKPGGRLLLNVLNGESAAVKGSENGIARQFKGLDTQYDPQSKILTTNRVLNIKGEEYSYEFKVRLYNASELTHMLEMCGLVPLEWHGDWAGSALTNASAQIFVVAEKSFVA
ncbi:SAM-dependent methyltransferase [Pseudoalteromonas obscura]|uniref:Class I SAM-dependent methyltransferase n=1 Tax=Pseudoalteromonas obscura TaxID=3048491 RepID=A0ABT7ENC5_9GAMM|nr:class I SAM-dependent methyltransferase [Pseudoalteromonas sp. P94(2023)]MDK2596552.1 class I SAM-dependent methyltransferase [Pseudoalteromonas sp. P94(2023)]